MVEVGESEYDPTIVQFGFSLLHAGGPPLRSMELRHRRACCASQMMDVSQVTGTILAVSSFPRTVCVAPESCPSCGLSSFRMHSAFSAHFSLVPCGFAITLALSSVQFAPLPRWLPKQGR